MAVRTLLDDDDNDDDDNNNRPYTRLLSIIPLFTATYSRRLYSPASNNNNNNDDTGARGGKIFTDGLVLLLLYSLCAKASMNRFPCALGAWLDKTKNFAQWVQIVASLLVEDSPISLCWTRIRFPPTLLMRSMPRALNDRHESSPVA